VKSSRLPLRTALLAALALLAVAAPSASATDGFSLELSGPSKPAVVNQPVILQATIQNPPPAEYWYGTWLDVALLRPEAVTECPFDSGNANQIATSTGGAILSIAQRQNVDVNGHSSLPIGFTPIVTGPLLICAYTYNEVGFTLAQASRTVDVQPAGAAAKPKVKRSGKRLVCQGGTGGATYGWSVNGRTKPGARGRTLRITRGLRGKRVACTVSSGGVTTKSRALRVRR
jgi:hypothetical protein